MASLVRGRTVGAATMIGALAVLVLLVACTAALAAASGTRLWRVSYAWPNGPFHSGALSAAAPDGSLYVCGTYLKGGSPPRTVPYVAKYGPGKSSQGWWRWEQAFFNYPLTQINDIGVDKHGNVYTCGTLAFNETDLDVLLLKHSPAGQLLWARIWGQAGRVEMANAMAVSTGGVVWLAGAAQDSAGADYDYLMMRWSSDGSLVWSEAREAGLGYDDIAYDVVLDGVGGVVFTGVTRTPAGDLDCVTLRRTTKVVGWQWYPPRTYAGGARGDEEAPRLARGPKGTVYLALESYAGPSRWKDIVLVTYDRDHKRRWTRRYDGPDHRGDRLTGLAVDRYGNAYIAGVSERAQMPGESALAIRYTAGGTRKWAKLFRKVKAGHGAVYFDVALDRSRRPYFGGRLGKGDDANALLAAYARSGTLRWRRTYDGPAHLHDVLVSLSAFGTSLYGSGASQAGPTNVHGVVVKYRQ